MTQATLIPSGDRILVTISREDMTSGGLHVPGTAQVHMVIGTVVQVGPGKHTISGDIIPMPFAKGDRILFPMKSSLKINFGQEVYYLVEHHYVVGVVTGELVGFNAVDLRAN